MDPMDSIGTTFNPPVQHECKSRIENMLFQWNLFVSDGSDGLHRNDFQPPRTHKWKCGNYSKSLTNRKYAFPVESIRIRWIRWTPSERLSTPTYNMNEITNRKYAFPVESIRVRWIRWTPSERLSTPTYNMNEITNRKYAFPVESIRVRWIRWTPSERLSTASYNISANHE